MNHPFILCFLPFLPLPRFIIHKITGTHFSSHHVIVQSNRMLKQHIDTDIGDILHTIQNRQLIPNAQIQFVCRLLYLSSGIFPRKHRSDCKKALRLSVLIMLCHYRPHGSYGIAYNKRQRRLPSMAQYHFPAVSAQQKQSVKIRSYTVRRQ